MNWLERTLLATGCAAALSAADAGAGSGSGDPLAPYLWQSRPVLVFAPGPGDPRLSEQVARLQADAAALRDRDVVLVEVAGDRARGRNRETGDAQALRRRFGVDGDAFAVILVGKDGTEKMRSREVTDPQALWDRIDTMPMRRREMRQDG